MTTYDEANLEACLGWVRERELVRIRKAGNYPHPCTLDPIIATYRFCNVRREDDRVTAWIKEAIRGPYAGHPYLWFMLCCARQINWPETLATLMTSPCAWPLDETFDPITMAAVMNRMAEDGAKVFTGAYIIAPSSVKGSRKTDHVALVTLGALWARRDIIGRLWGSMGYSTDDRWQPSMRAVHGELLKYDGWGPFLAYQAVVDMRFTPLLEDAPDVATWAAAGPGTLRGLNRLHGRRLDFKLGQAAALQEMRALWPLLQARAGVAMDLSDVPNVMCETDKYLRVRNGEGKPRALYVPGRGS